MKCENCKINVGGEFTYAIKANLCPRCGKQIMQATKLATFISLQELLKNNIANTGSDVEKIATLIIANFELKQIFKEEFANATPEKKFTEAVGEVVEEDSGPDIAVDQDGIKYEKLDKTKSQDILRRMRDEALEEALTSRDEIELTPENEVLLSEDPKVNAELLKQRQKQMDAQEAVLNGGAGKQGFRRSE